MQPSIIKGITSMKTHSQAPKSPSPPKAPCSTAPAPPWSSCSAQVTSGHHHTASARSPTDRQGCHLLGITQQREDNTDFLRQNVSAGRRRAPSFEMHCLTGQTAISTSNTNPMCSNIHAGNTTRTAAFKMTPGSWSTRQ